jgi:hypothetical protein
MDPSASIRWMFRTAPATGALLTLPSTAVGPDGDVGLSEPQPLQSKRPSATAQLAATPAKLKMPKHHTLLRTSYLIVRERWDSHRAGVFATARGKRTRSGGIVNLDQSLIASLEITLATWRGGLYPGGSGPRRRRSGPPGCWSAPAGVELRLPQAPEWSQPHAIRDQRKRDLTCPQCAGFVGTVPPSLQRASSTADPRADGVDGRELSSSAGIETTALLTSVDRYGEMPRHSIQRIQGETTPIESLIGSGDPDQFLPNPSGRNVEADRP